MDDLEVVQLDLTPHKATDEEIQIIEGATPTGLFEGSMSVVCNLKNDGRDTESILVLCLLMRIYGSDRVDKWFDEHEDGPDDDDDERSAA